MIFFVKTETSGKCEKVYRKTALLVLGKILMCTTSNDLKFSRFFSTGSMLRNKQIFRIFFTRILFKREHLLKYSKMTRLFFRKLYYPKLLNLAHTKSEIVSWAISQIAPKK